MPGFIRKAGQAVSKHGALPHEPPLLRMNNSPSLGSISESQKVFPCKRPDGLRNREIEGNLMDM